MKRLKQILTCVMVPVLISACKKELPVTIENHVEFHFTAGINAVTKSFRAGQDYYYMGTEITGDLNFGSPGIAECTGEFIHVLGLNNEESIKFIIRNVDFGQVSQSRFDSLLLNGSLNYRQKTPSYRVNFSPAFPTSVGSYSWDFGDGLNSSENNPTHLYPVNGPGKYNVCLTVQTPGGCTDMICSDVFLPHALCTSEIQISQDSSRTSYNVNYKAITTGTGPFYYTWNFENGVTVNTQDVKFAYNLSPGLIERVRLNVVDATGCSTDIAVNLPINNPTGQCYINFNYPPPVLDSLGQSIGLGTVEIQYTNTNGMVYSSFNGNQLPESYFRVLNFNEYSPDVNGNRTKAMDVEANCRMFDENGNYVTLQQGTGRIAIAY